MAKKLRSFRPVCGPDSRVLVLGTMPGPEALRRRQYYGFPGNHFWKIMPRLFPPKAPAKFRSYRDKIRFLKRHHIALWDVIESCQRTGALDSAIRRIAPNDIPGLLGRHPGIRAVLLNGKTAERLFRKHFASPACPAGRRVTLPTRTLPSTSPAHAAMSLSEKLRRWRILRRCVERASS